MVSKVEIISDAFNLLGKASIDSIDVDAPPIVRSASVLYDRFYEKALTMHTWRFAVLTRSLNKLVQTPIIDNFQNIFQLPADYLLAWRVHPNSDYEIFEDKIFSNEDELILEYTARVDEANLPPYFTTFFIEKMAEVLAMPVTQQIALVQLWGQAAQLSFKTAAALDSGSRTTNVVVRDQIFDSKFSTFTRIRPKVL